MSFKDLIRWGLGVLARDWRVSILVLASLSILFAALGAWLHWSYFFSSAFMIVSLGATSWVLGEEADKGL